MIKKTSSARLSYLIRQVQLATRARLEEVVREFDITVAQYTVLSILNRNDQLSSADLSRHIEVTPQSMNELIANLERKDLVVRSENPDNRRIRRISLTRRGKEVIRVCELRVTALEAEIFQDFESTELDQFREALIRTLTRLRKPRA
jgi:DNA-binding MarR family transcriptional regulator